MTPQPRINEPNLRRWIYFLTADGLITGLFGLVIACGRKLGTAVMAGMVGGAVTSTGSWSGPATSAPGLEISAFVEPAGLRLNYQVRNLSGVRVEHCNLLPTVDGKAVSTSKVLFGPLEPGGVATVTFHFKGAYKAGQQLHPNTEMDFDYKGGSGHLADQKPVFVQ